MAECDPHRPSFASLEATMAPLTGTQGQTQTQTPALAQTQSASSAGKRASAVQIAELAPNSGSSSCEIAGPCTESSAASHLLQLRQNLRNKFIPKFQIGLPANFIRLGKQRIANSFSSSSPSKDQLAELLFALPTELHILILIKLNFADLLALRLASQSFNNLIKSCESAIVRHYVKHVGKSWEYELYPPPRPNQASITYLINLKHRTNTCQKLAAQLCNFVARDILRRNTARKRREFSATWHRMYDRLVPLLFTLSHFFEEYRRIILERCVSRSKSGQNFLLNSGSTLWDDQMQIMDKYDPMLLLDCYHMYGFMLQAFERKLRPPAMASTFERFIRGWTAKPATTQEIEILLMLGGMDQVQRVLSHRTYNERRKALDNFIKGLSPTKNPAKWREHWTELGVANETIRLDKIPNTKIAVPALHLIWVPNALNLLLQKEIIEHVDFGGDSSVRSTRDFVSDLVGYDILRFSSPPPQPLDNDEDDDDVSDSEEEDEDSEDGSDDDDLDV
ncbi:hypothetical protein K402DRAFT_352400 [Aulographum hederae CBS 113979]|uniref:F-box domain-containing protein n=1 Tax=Aulographum hederae CBS 113979 TaxID=1176131 RepID=A0A6G1H550_9PEZI|nr:hypothetical protein K402DRAFT_352400 [Aulographum hederae CBS 113979]